jgi:hypothetical protein
MKRLVIASAVLAALVLFPLASFAAAPASSGAQAVAATGALLQPAPLDQAKPLMCGPQEDEFGVFWYPYFGGGHAECESDCTTYCQNGGGYLLESVFDPRTPSCTCDCCA